MTLDIKIREGLGELKFGMPVEEVSALWGQAGEVESIDSPCDEPTTVLHYDNLGATLFFEGENPCLQCIDIHNTDCRLFGQRVFDLDEVAVVRLMVSNQYFEQDVENEDWGERRVSFSEGNIDFFFEGRTLLSVVFGR